MLEYLIGNIFVEFAGRIFQQIIDIWEVIVLHCLPICFLLLWGRIYTGSKHSLSNSSMLPTDTWTMYYLRIIQSFQNASNSSAHVNLKIAKHLRRYLVLHTWFFTSRPTMESSILGLRQTGWHDFSFPIFSCPFLSSNISFASAYGVHVSRLIRYARAYSIHQDPVVQS